MDKFLVRRTGAVVQSVHNKKEKKEKKQDVKTVNNVNNDYTRRGGVMLGGREIKGIIGNEDVQCIYDRVRVLDKIYPPTEWRADLRERYKRFKVADASPLPGQGLFLRVTAKTIKAGDFVGIYAGIVNRFPTEYSMRISPSIIIDGTPQDDDPIWYMSRINDWIWSDAGQNCEIKNGGVIIAKLDIKPGQQIFMHYSMDYDWSQLKWQGIVNMWDRLHKVQESLGSYKFSEDIQQMKTLTQTMTANGRCRGLGELSDVCEACMEGVPEKLLHRFVPRQLSGDTFGNWVERVVRHTEWQRQYFYRNWKPWEPENWEWLSNINGRFTRMPRQAHKVPVVDIIGSVASYEIDDSVVAETCGVYSSYNPHVVRGREAGESQDKPLNTSGRSPGDNYITKGKESVLHDGITLSVERSVVEAGGVSMIIEVDRV
jgi:hypothetical protein